MAYLDSGLNFRYNFRLKTHPNPQIAAILNISKYLRQIHFDIRCIKSIANYYIKSVFDVHDVTDDVTALRQIVPSIFM